MVKTLAQLRKENEALKKKIKMKQMMLEKRGKTNELLRENKKLLREIKHPGVFNTKRIAKGAFKGTKQAYNKYKPLLSKLNKKLDQISGRLAG